MYTQSMEGALVYNVTPFIYSAYKCKCARNPMHKSSMVMLIILMNVQPEDGKKLLLYILRGIWTQLQ